MIDKGPEQRISALPGPLGPQRARILSGFFSRAGNGLFDTAAVLYFTLVVQLPAAQVGAGLTIAGPTGLLAGIPAGNPLDGPDRGHAGLNRAGARHPRRLRAQPGGVGEPSAGFVLGFGLAPDHAQGRYQGFLDIGFDAGQALAPVILTGAVLGRGDAGWLLLARSSRPWGRQWRDGLAAAAAVFAGVEAPRMLTPWSGEN
ncbi:hypothetical protein [Streptomyces sp. NPDC018031]|uniref:hypothetical protein n=1 Tax=Streptomyces sp. NPDC018031 TaxID=3365033 RepID=UPI003798A2A5